MKIIEWRNPLLNTSLFFNNACEFIEFMIHICQKTHTRFFYPNNQFI
jgi:hypothetical protein